MFSPELETSYVRPLAWKIMKGCSGGERAQQGSSILPRGGAELAELESLTRSERQRVSALLSAARGNLEMLKLANHPHASICREILLNPVSSLSIENHFIVDVSHDFNH